jgi:hypothetical protein
MFLKNILDKMKIECSTPLVLNNNQSAIALTKNGKEIDRAKHIILKYLKVREYFRNNIFELKYVQSEHNLADLFTKGLPRKQFEFLRDQMMQMID